MADEEILPGSTAQSGQETPPVPAQPAPAGQDVNDLDWQKLPYEVPADMRAAISEQFRERERLRSAQHTRKLQEASKYEEQARQAQQKADAFDAVSARLAEIEATDPLAARAIISKLTPGGNGATPSHLEEPQTKARGWQKKEDIAQYIEQRLERFAAEQIQPHVTAIREERMSEQLGAALKQLPYEDLQGKRAEVLARWKAAPSLSATEAIHAVLGPELARRAAVSATRTESGGFEERLAPPKKYLRTEDALRAAMQKHGVQKLV